MRKKEEISVSSSETRNSLKKGSLLKRIGSICSRSRNKGHDGNIVASSMPSLLKEEETETYLSDDDSCLWLSSSTSPTSFFDERSSFVEEWMMISPWVVSAMPNILDDDDDGDDGDGSWVMEFEKDMSFLVDLDVDQWDYSCVPSSFPSPSFKTSRETKLMSASLLPSDVPVSDLEHLKVADDDESPLLWPFEGWNPEETWSFFVMSPRKEYIANSKHQHAVDAHVDAQISRRRKISIHRKVVNSDSEAESVKQQKRDMKNKLMGPSRLIKSSWSKNSEALMRVVPLEMMKVDHDDKSIEMLVGLEEFDGNEGMESSQEHINNVVNNGGVGDHIFTLED